MDTNALMKLAQEADDALWFQFLAGGEQAEDPYGGVPQATMQDLHGIAKDAFVREVEAACNGQEDVLAWALSMVDPELLEVGIAKNAQVVLSSSPAMLVFMEKSATAGDDPDELIEDLHELAKTAFVHEVRALLEDEDLVKVALEHMPDDLLDRAIAAEAMGLEKVAILGIARAAGGAIANMGRSMAGGTMKGLGKGLKRWGNYANEMATGAANKHIAAGKALAKGPKGGGGSLGLGPIGPGQPVKRTLGTLRKDFGEARLQQAKSVGARRTALGDRLMQKGDDIAMGRKAAPKPAANAPDAPTPTPTSPVPKPTADPKIPAEWADEAAERAANPAGAKPPADAPSVTPEVLAPDGTPISAGPADKDGFWGWFNSLPKEQQILLGGGAAVGAEAALD